MAENSLPVVPSLDNDLGDGGATQLQGSCASVVEQTIRSNGCFPGRPGGRGVEYTMRGPAPTEPPGEENRSAREGDSGEGVVARSSQEIVAKKDKNLKTFWWLRAGQGAAPPSSRLLQNVETPGGRAGARPRPLAFPQPPAAPRNRLDARRYSTGTLRPFSVSRERRSICASRMARKPINTSTPALRKW